MKVQTWKRISKEDLGKLPPSLNSLYEKGVKVINTQLESLTDLAKESITFGDNFNSELVVIAVKNGVEKRVRLKKLKGKAVRAEIEDSGRYHVTNVIYPKPLLWSVVDQGMVAFRVAWEDAPTGEFTVKIRFFGE